MPAQRARRLASLSRLEGMVSSHLKSTAHDAINRPTVLSKNKSSFISPPEKSVGIPRSHNRPAVVPRN